MTEWGSLPERYWHCAVAVGTGKKDKQRAVVNDLMRDEIRVQIVEPWRQGKAFVVGGAVIKERGVSEIRIARTEHPKKYYADEHNARMRASGIADMGTNRSLLPLGKGTDFTHELLFRGLGEEEVVAPDVSLLLRLCARLPEAARVLAVRKRGRLGFSLADEYDAQDLLHALVRSVFKYAVVEEPVGIVGGGQSSRADLALEDLGALVELKFARRPGDQERLISEFAEDLLLYTKWAPLRTFIFVVVNSRDLRDPEALERLGGPTTINGKSYRAHVILA